MDSPAAAMDHSAERDQSQADHRERWRLGNRRAAVDSARIGGDDGIGHEVAVDIEDFEAGYRRRFLATLVS
jgi:hypothetical protein